VGISLLYIAGAGITSL